jgi:SAM-dependent methyltransferase
MAQSKERLVQNGKLSLLDIGAGPEPVSREFFPDATILTLDIDPDNSPDYVHDIRAPLPDDLYHKFDVVFASHVLEHIEYRMTRKTLTSMASALKPGGELWIIVPSLEWIADEIAAESKNMAAVIASIYGGQGSPFQYHKSGFTIAMLRQIMSSMGLIIRQAKHGRLQIHWDSSNPDDAATMDAIQNIVVGMSPPVVGGSGADDLAMGAGILEAQDGKAKVEA